MKKEVFFLSDHKSARAHMTEGVLRTMYGRPYIAGGKTAGINPVVSKSWRKAALICRNTGETSEDMR